MSIWQSFVMLNNCLLSHIKLILKCLQGLEKLMRCPWYCWNNVLMFKYSQKEYWTKVSWDFHYHGHVFFSLTPSLTSKLQANRYLWQLISTKVGSAYRYSIKDQWKEWAWLKWIWWYFNERHVIQNHTFLFIMLPIKHFFTWLHATVRYEWAKHD